MGENRQISVIIPNRNRADTIGMCIESVLQSDYDNFEIVVVDDGSEDRSVEIIKRYPCKLITFKNHYGTSRARNEGAKNSTGEILFFTDSDCLLERDTLKRVNESFERHGSECIISGTYTLLPYDKDFFSAFQSITIHYAETKKDSPDYAPAHAMVISAEVFKKSEGFPENFLPIIEDVEFSHRMRRRGYRIVLDASIQVKHIFNFSFIKSLKNAFRKSLYWSIYSLHNRDIHADSGAASSELKMNVVMLFIAWVMVISGMVSDLGIFYVFSIIALLISGIFNRKLLFMFYRAKGWRFCLLAGLYYLFIYPLPVGLGAITGVVMYISGKYKLSLK
jgi:glycosyltransferase involved in cell wall biosynthesis